MKAKLRALLVLALLGATARTAWAMPPDPVPERPWFSAPLYGGPVFAVGVGTNRSGAQLVYAGGEEVFTSSRGGTWRATKPVVGRVASLVPAQGGVAFASSAADGRGYRTPDGGQTWGEVRVRGTEPVRFLATSPNFAQDGVAFAITTSDRRLYRTDKGTGNWIEVIYVTDVPHETGAVALSPIVRADETIFAGTNRGLYKSTDKGQTWQLWSTAADGVPAFGQPGGPPEGQGLVLPKAYGDDPDQLGDTDLRTLFAYNAEGLFRSDDDGRSWRPLTLAAERVLGLAVSNGFPADPILMAAVAGGGKVAALSNDGGASWRLLDGPSGVSGTGVAMARDFARELKEVDPRTRYLYFPMTMKRADRPGPPAPPLPPETGSREAYLATDGDGVWRSRDAGLTWTREWAGLANVQPTSLAYLPAHGGDDALLVGTRAAGLYRSLDGGRSARAQASELPRGAAEDVYALAVSPAFASDRSVYLGATSGVWLSRDAGRSWRLTAGPKPARWVSISPAFARDRTLVADGLISKDGGDTWAELPTIDGPVAFSPSYETDRTLWAGGPYLRRSTDGGETWTDFQSVPVLRSRPVLAVLTVQVVPGEYRIFAATDRGIVQSFDNGEDWANSPVTTRAVRALAATVTQEPQAALVAAAGDDGLLWSTNRGVSWGKLPTSPKPASAVTTAVDASTLVGNAPLRISRYGYGNARVSLPIGYK